MAARSEINHALTRRTQSVSDADNPMQAEARRYCMACYQENRVCDSSIMAAYACECYRHHCQCLQLRNSAA